MPNITTNNAVNYTNLLFHVRNFKIAMATFRAHGVQVLNAMIERPSPNLHVHAIVAYITI